jgi:hypothetical protein
MNNSMWVQVHLLNSPVLASIHLDKNGKDAVIMTFPATARG